MVNRDQLRNTIYELATLGANPWANKSVAERYKEDNNQLQRLARLALLRAGDFGGNKLYASLATRSYRQAGEEVVGLGFHSVVLGNGPANVKKVHHRTHLLTHGEQQSEVLDLQRRQQPILDIFGPQASEQSFTIEPFPLNKERSCVMAHQERIRTGIPVDMSESTDALQGFLETSRRMYDATGQIPDIVGLANMFETPDGIVIVDTIPLSVENSQDTQTLKIAHQILAFHGLGQGLVLDR